MQFLTDLWLPILLSAVFVFIASSVIHMVLQLHNKDFGKLPDEDAVMNALRSAGVQPGQYMFPCPGSMKELGTPEMQAKFEQGPVGQLVVRPNGMLPMGKSLMQWFLYSLLISVFCGYLGSLALPAGENYHTVFRVTGTVAVLGYAFAYPTYREGYAALRDEAAPEAEEEAPAEEVEAAEVEEAVEAEAAADEAPAEEAAAEDAPAEEAAAEEAPAEEAAPEAEEDSGDAEANDGDADGEKKE